MQANPEAVPVQTVSAPPVSAPEVPTVAQAPMPTPPSPATAPVPEDIVVTAQPTPKEDPLKRANEVSFEVIEAADKAIAAALAPPADAAALHRLSIERLQQKNTKEAVEFAEQHVLGAPAYGVGVVEHPVDEIGTPADGGFGADQQLRRQALRQVGERRGAARGAERRRVPDVGRNDRQVRVQLRREVQGRRGLDTAETET